MNPMPPPCPPGSTATASEWIEPAVNDRFYQTQIIRKKKTFEVLYVQQKEQIKIKLLIV